MAPYLPSRRLRSSRSSRSRSWPIIFTLGCIVAFSAISLFYVAHSTVWNEALHKLDIQKKNLDQSHLPPPLPRVDKQQQLQQRQGSENNNLRAPKNDDEDSYPGKRNYNILLCIYWSSFFTFYVPLNIIFDGHTSSYNAKHCTSIILL